MPESLMLPEGARRWISDLGLEPHPEGGYFRERIRSQRCLSFREMPGADRTDPGEVAKSLVGEDKAPHNDEHRLQRQALTSIEFLLPQGQVSRWHRVQSDEVWIWLDGAPLLLLDATGKTDEPALEMHLDAHHRQALIPARHWQAARSLGEYTLVACVVAPGFEFADFELIEPTSPDASALAKVHPDGVMFT